MSGPTGHVLWSRGFRPFFLLAGLAACSGIVVWLGLLRGIGPVPDWSTPIAWHAHEMTFGFAGAAIAGFLLTSVPVWTGRPPLVGARLAALVGLWIAGRAAVFFAGSLPAPWVAGLIDVSFMLTVALAIAPAIYGSESRRNFAFPLLLAVLAFANGLSHLAESGIRPTAGPIAARLGIGVLLVLVVTLGGRLVPLFTSGALKRDGQPDRVTRVVWADRAAAPVVAVAMLAHAVAPDSSATGVLALTAGGIVGIRASGWAFRSSLGDPLLWSMYVAHAWIPLGLLALGASALGAGIPRASAVHALTVGAIAGMILAIMTRVPLGHTGRPLRAPQAMVGAYLLVHAAAFARSVLPVVAPGWTGELLLASGTLLALGFGVFLAVYGPMLVAPRIDGRPG